MKRGQSKAVVALFALAPLVVGNLGWARVAEAAVSAQQIVERADRVRFPSAGFQVDVKISTIEGERKPEVRQYRIVSKGNEKTLVMTMAPAVDRGQILLMRSTDLWVYLPGVSQPVRLPLSQKLTGQVANGDLARANFAGDYEPKLIRTEEIDGKDHYVLELIAARRGVTYHRVLYWVNKKNFWPYKAEFFTVSKKMLKRCYYQAFKKMAGGIRPTRLVLEDTLRTSQKSVMNYGEIKLRKLSDKVFTKEYLKKLQ